MAAGQTGPRRRSAGHNIWHGTSGDSGHEAEYQAAPRTNNERWNPWHMRTGAIQEWEIRKRITEAKANKAAGPDGIPMDVLKHRHDSNVEAITYVPNGWWRREELPAEANLAEVVSIFKKGGPGNLDNYRPISPSEHAVYNFRGGNQGQVRGMPRGATCIIQLGPRKAGARRMQVYVHGDSWTMQTKGATDVCSCSWTGKSLR